MKKIVISDGMIIRHLVKSCCGSNGLIFETDKPIRKSQIKIFKEAGYLVPDNFLAAGLFYVQKDFLIATASFGSNKISVRCNGEKCSDYLDAFALCLEQAINV